MKNNVKNMRKADSIPRIKSIRDLLPSEEKRDKFITKWVQPSSNFPEVIFNRRTLHEFFGIYQGWKLRRFFGGVRIRPVEKDIRAKLPVPHWQGKCQEPLRRDNHKKRPGRWVDIGKQHLEELVGRHTANVVFRYFKGICLYIPAGSLERREHRRQLEEKVISMLKDGMSNKVIALTIGRSCSWVSGIKKKYISF
jgi:hypothetical protein